MADFLRSIERLEQRGPVNRVLVIKPSALGDVAQSLPLLTPLRRRFPAAEFAWVIGRESASLLEGHRDLSELFVFERHGGLRRQLELYSKLRASRFDLVIDLQGLLRTGLMCLVSGGRLRVGLETAREGSAWSCHTLIPGTGRSVPAHERYWRVAEALRQGDSPRVLGLDFSPEIQAKAEFWLASLPRPIMAVHAGAKWETKRWPPEKFSAVVREYLRSSSGSCVLVGGPAETSLAEAIRTGLPDHSPVINLAGRSSLKELAAVLASVDLMLSNDSGPMHLAAGLGTPVVGLFTCTSPVISGPVGTGHECVATGVACAASYHKTCPRPGSGKHACFSELDVSRVVAAVRRQMSKLALTPHDAARRAG